MPSENTVCIPRLKHSGQYTIEPPLLVLDANILANRTAPLTPNAPILGESPDRPELEPAVFVCWSPP